MDTRIALKKGTILTFYNHDGGIVKYTVQEELARGGSCIVYNGAYTNNLNDSKVVRIKECYPLTIDIHRSKDGNLSASVSDNQMFQEEKTRIAEAFSLCNKLFKQQELSNLISNTIDLYSANGTLYIVSTYVQGENLGQKSIDSLRDCITLVKSTAKAISNIHKEGYLYLDIKPENILTLRSTNDIVQLFDFDSVISMQKLRAKQMTDFRISYTKGFAPIELQLGRRKQIGKQTDVYGIAALLFYLIFGRTPSVFDCAPNSKFNFAESKFGIQSYRDELFLSLTKFFNKALADFYLDRYEDMDMVVHALTDIEKFADTEEPYIQNSFAGFTGLFLGREKEMCDLSNWMKGHGEKMITVTGIGGIGKSSFVRKCLTDEMDSLDRVIYVNYENSLEETIANDIAFSINTIGRREEEKLTDYYIRKLNMARNLVKDKKVILVIDNFEDHQEDFSQLLLPEWKVILISRQIPEIEGCKNLEIGSFEDKKNLFNIFEYYLNQNGRYLNKEDTYYLEQLIDKISGHTLLVELIAKQVAKSYLTVREAITLAEDQGLGNIADEKISYVRDHKKIYDSLKNIINGLFDTAGLSEEKKTVLKGISLFGSSGIDIRLFANIVHLQNKDVINELMHDGWIKIDGFLLLMHPVIKEATLQWKMTEEYEQISECIMNFLFKQLKMEGYREDYPKKLIELQQKMKEYQEKNPYSDKILQFLTRKKGVIGEITKERVYTVDKNKTTDFSVLNVLLRFSKDVLKTVEKIPELYCKDICKNLLYCTVINMPRDQEAYIFENAEKLINDPASKNGLALMELYDIQINILEETKDIDAIWIIVKDAEKLAKRCRDSHVTGKYYYLLAGAYDVELSGYYDAETAEEKRILKEQLKAVDKAIHYMRKARHADSKMFLGECLRFKATLMIRSYPEEKKQINKLLSEIKDIIDKESQSNSSLVRDYYMACAWYHTYVEPNVDNAGNYIKDSIRISRKICRTKLDIIDDVISPSANIFMELQEYDMAETFLRKAIEFCAEQETIIVYIRKKMELYGYLLDVYYFGDMLDKAKELLKLIDEENLKYESLDNGVHCDVPLELRNLIDEA